MASRILKQIDSKYYIKPHPLFTPYIAHYTVEFNDHIYKEHQNQKEMISSSQEERLISILPDASGCIVVTHYGNSTDSVFWSPTTKTVVVKSDFEVIPLRIYIEFLSGGARYFKGIDEVREADLKLPLILLNKELSKQLEEIAQKGMSLKEIVLALDQVLLQYFVEEQKQLIAMIPYIKQQIGITSVRDLADQTFYSTRHLNRLFHEGLGMNAKTYLRLVRINQGLEFMTNKDLDFTMLSQQLGYYDQAHFIHDFKAVCGVTPGRYCSNMSDFYNEMFKF